ncbi:hypothetical protein M8C11_18815 [Micromonospora sp. CPM1]|uniref:hypothetical protein n=1 Tax=Micromonospora sp. CPM1 TaxID=2944809 RepID=UPI00207D1B8D|nr:hypothetical protein [Micromonospora sp. CPM1]MCO1616769.1 hypothetical protein [Micromonospora sp. CPM1]
MYQLRKPAEAVQYTEDAYEALVALVKSAHPNASYDNYKKGYFRAYNGGADFSVELGQWLVKIGKSLTVMNDDQFRELFEPVA